LCPSNSTCAASNLPSGAETPWEVGIRNVPDPPLRLQDQGLSPYLPTVFASARERDLLASLLARRPRPTTRDPWQARPRARSGVPESARRRGPGAAVTVRRAPPGQLQAAPLPHLPRAPLRSRALTEKRSRSVAAMVSSAPGGRAGASAGAATGTSRLRDALRPGGCG
jgi:hypothetical protein